MTWTSFWYGISDISDQFLQQPLTYGLPFSKDWLTGDLVSSRPSFFSIAWRRETSLPPRSGWLPDTKGGSCRSRVTWLFDNDTKVVNQCRIISCTSLLYNLVNSLLICFGLDFQRLAAKEAQLIHLVLYRCWISNQEVRFLSYLFDLLAVWLETNYFNVKGIGWNDRKGSSDFKILESCDPKLASELKLRGDLLSEFQLMMKFISFFQS